MTEGSAGLITGHTHHAELSHLGSGFYANTGCGTEVVEEVPSRLAGIGLPPVFLGHRADTAGLHHLAVFVFAVAVVFLAVTALDRSLRRVGRVR